jgi:DNA repair exonuclease SbcCD ATPase subunit
MIVFNKITAKNFLSLGNVPTSIPLNTHKNTLIVGTNGSGKSSLCTDSICFALYGKPYRNIVKNQLVNSINQKGLEVEIDFSVGPVEYRVKRGIKPNIFEIYQDGKLIDQEAATKDYQQYLERQILKINFKTFCQVVILGTASFVPFMNLSASQRRDVIEDVLDIAVFSDMNTVLKNRMSELQEEIKDTSQKIDTAKKETLTQKKLIQVLEDAKSNRIQEEELNIDTLLSVIERHREIINEYKSKIDILEQPENVDVKIIQQLERVADLAETEIQANKRKLNSIGALSDCPTCLQSVGEHHKTLLKKQFTHTEVELTAQLSIHKSQLNELDQKLSAQREYETTVKSYNDQIIREYDKIAIHETEVNKKQKLIKSIRADVTDISIEKTKLKTIADTALTLLQQKNDLMDIRNIQEISQLLLKDTGIKAAIIKEYVPILNKMINKYLAMFGFHINFILDENFNETIRSRGRDEFSYSSFSEGEKRKIDTAILFAFRQISELKNSANCNLLVLDEVGSENFDLNAKECFLEILSSIEGGNNFIISHSSPSHEAYDCVYKVEKRGDFSNMELMN